MLLDHSIAQLRSELKTLNSEIIELVRKLRTLRAEEAELGKKINAANERARLIRSEMIERLNLDTHRFLKASSDGSGDNGLPALEE